MKIKNIFARQILDSRGNPTVETDVVLDNGALGRAAVPSGASTGSREALELRDEGKEYSGLGVQKAVNNINTVTNKALTDFNFDNQAALDAKLITLDGTNNKSSLGTNAILSVSMAALKTAALSKNLPLYKYIAEITNNHDMSLPVPLMNIINGGKHAAGSTDIQEYMIIPAGFDSFKDALRAGAEIFHLLKEILQSRGYATLVGDEGGFAPGVKYGNKEALDLILEAIQKAGYEAGENIFLGIDVAASELYEDGRYNLQTESQKLSTDQMINWLQKLPREYPIISIEDGLAEDDWDGWQELTQNLGKSIQLVGDDLFVTNTRYIQKGIDLGVANTVLIKPNQIGTITEAFAAVKLAKDNNYRTIMSHRSGETEDTTIAHLAVGLNCGQIKTGSLSRSERIAKYNELLRIEEEQGDNAHFAGKAAFKSMQ